MKKALFICLLSVLTIIGFVIADKYAVAEKSVVATGPAKACVTTFVDYAVVRELFGNSDSVVLEIEAKCGGGADASACEPIHFSITMDYIGGTNQVFDHQFASGTWTPGLCDSVVTTASCRCIPLFPGSLYNYTVQIDGMPPILGQIVP